MKCLINVLSKSREKKTPFCVCVCVWMDGKRIGGILMEIRIEHMQGSLNFLFIVHDNNSGNQDNKDNLLDN